MNTIKSTWSWLNRAWCNVAHPTPLWPIHGKYQCPSCFRVYQVGWEAGVQRSMRVQ